MSGSFSRYISVVVAFVFAIAMIVLAENTSAQAACPAGTVTITTATRAIATLAGIPASSQCWTPSSSTTGAAAGQAKADLAKMANGPGACQTTAPASFEQLDPAFAICADRFLQAVRQRDPNVHITSAYRNNAQQACVCRLTSGPCAAPGSSNHQKGIAIDIQDGGMKILPSWIQAMGQGYGINFPIAGDSGHMQPIPGSNCSDPNFTPTDTSGGAGPATPTSAITSAIQKLFNPQQQAAPAAQPAPAPAPTVTAAQPITSQPVPATQPAVSATPIVTTGSSVLTAQTQPSLTSTAVATSALDLLEALANPISGTTSSAVGTSGALYLNAGANDIGEIQTVIQAGAGTSSYGGSDIADGVSDQTFTSGDLANDQNGYQPQQSGSTFSQILTSLSAILVGLLHYLQPFGGNVPSQNLSE